jgi:hypothetical protein
VSRGQRNGFPRPCGVKVNERAELEAKQSKKTEIINYSYQWQISKSSGKRKATKNFTVFIKTPNGKAEKTTLQGTTGMARLRGSAR